jgi:hypothetical protein
MTRRLLHLGLALGIALGAVVLPALTGLSAHHSSTVGAITLAGDLPQGDQAVIGDHPSDPRDTWSNSSLKRFLMLLGVAAAILLCCPADRRAIYGQLVGRGQRFSWTPQSGRAPPFLVS